MINDIIIPTPGSIVRTFVDGINKERIIKVKQVVITHDNSYIIRYDDDKGEESGINCSWVTEVISHGTTTPKPINYFDGNQEDTYLHYKRTMYCGSLISIVRNCMAKLPYRITRPIDWKKIEALFEKTRPGYVGGMKFGIGDHVGYPIIKKKKIQQWVAKNWHKFLRNEKEWNKAIQINNKKISDMYWKNIELEMERDMVEDFY